MGKVIHVSDALHAKIVAHCKSKGVGIKPWAEHILTEAIRPFQPVPVEKKPQLDVQGGQPSERPDIWKQPPFWKGDENKLEGHSPGPSGEAGKASS